MATKIKTSISIPAKNADQWRLHRKQISTQLQGYLREFHRQKTRRIGLKQFSDCEQGLARFNVYWDQQTYNQLHAVAHALCMSVSHLLWQILMFIVTGREVRSFFSNYAFEVIHWAAGELSFSETLTFTSTPPAVTKAKNPNNGDKPPLRFTA